MELGCPSRCRLRQLVANVRQAVKCQRPSGACMRARGISASMPSKGHGLSPSDNHSKHRAVVPTTKKDS